MGGAMDGVSIRAVIDMPILDETEGTVAIGEIVEIEARDVTAGSVWRGVAAEVVTVTVVASAAVIRIDASVRQSVATMSLARKAKAIAARAVAPKGVVAMATATAVIPTGPMEVAWKAAGLRAIGAVEKLPATT